MRALLIFLALVFAFTARAADRVFESAPKRTHLIELFTSQGCSSCPPAEVWLSKLKNEPGLWKNFAPIAFHVDYWDRLGWRDPFAAVEWTARQYGYSDKWKSESVYTPSFVLDGHEWHNPEVPKASNEKPGVLQIAIVDGEVSGTYIPADGQVKVVRFYIAQLGFDLATKVTAGENSGRSLRQDFVVLSLQSREMSNGQIKITLPGESRTGAIVAWITARDELEPIQATGGWIY
jgi:hypothetical protein